MWTIVGGTFLIMLLCQFWVWQVSSGHLFHRVEDLPSAYTVMVLGARVHPSGPSIILRDRLDKALEAYRRGKAKRFLLTGDHGQKEYDEVNAMMDYLVKKGVPSSDIFLDHAGFDTYNSMARAKQIFEVDSLVVVTQEFHLARSVFIARSKGLHAVGLVADKNPYKTIYYLWFRESLARVKASMEVLFQQSPVYLGEKIPITGDSQKSYDQKR
jgi:SanA protein